MTCLHLLFCAPTSPHQQLYLRADVVSVTEQQQQQQQHLLVVSEQFDAHPAPQVEEDVDGDGDGQQQAVEAQTAAAGAALWEVLVHSGREEQTTQRHDGHQHHQVGQGEHAAALTP